MLSKDVNNYRYIRYVKYGGK